MGPHPPCPSLHEYRKRLPAPMAEVKARIPPGEAGNSVILTCTVSYHPLLSSLLLPPPGPFLPAGRDLCMADARHHKCLLLNTVSAVQALQLGKVISGLQGSPCPPTHTHTLLAMKPFNSNSPGADCPERTVPVCTQRRRREGKRGR